MYFTKLMLVGAFACVTIGGSVLAHDAMPPAASEQNAAADNPPPISPQTKGQEAQNTVIAAPVDAATNSRVVAPQIKPEVRIIPKPPSRFGQKIHDVVLSADGKSLHVIGTFGRGLVDLLNRQLLANPGIKNIALSSAGGGLLDGLAVAEIIREKKLDTYVEMRCASACTFAFLAGQQRIIAPHARIGFHRASSPNIFSRDKNDDVDSVGNQVMRNVYTAANLDPIIVENTLKTSPDDLWTPDAALLMSSGVVTRISGQAEFAVNAGDLQSAQQLDLRMKEDPVMVRIAALYPKEYGNLESAIWDKIALGENKDKLLAQARSIFLPMIISKRRTLPDEWIDQYIALEKEIWTAKDNAINENCIGNRHQWAFPVGIAETPDQKMRQQALLLELLNIASDPAPYDAMDRERAHARLFTFFAKMIAKKHFESSQVFFSFCREPVGYFELLTELPRAERIEIFRNMIVTASSVSPAPWAFLHGF